MLMPQGVDLGIEAVESPRYVLYHSLVLIGPSPGDEFITG